MDLEKLKEKDDLILDVYEHPEFGDIRICITSKGKVLYSGNDCAKALGYKKPRNAIGKFVTEMHKVLLVNKNFRGPRSGRPKLNNFGEVFISDAGLYDLVLNSKMEKAKDFRNWITEEVIPAIRDDGYYDIDSAKRKPKKSIWDILGKEPNKKFKEDVQIQISTIARQKGMIKGKVWHEFVRVYNLLFHTNLSMKKNHIVDKYESKEMNIREFLDITDNHQRAMVTFVCMKLGSNLSKKDLEALMELYLFECERYSDFEIMAIEHRAKKFYEQNMKREKKKGKHKDGILYIDVNL